MVLLPCIVVKQDNKMTKQHNKIVLLHSIVTKQGNKMTKQHNKIVLLHSIVTKQGNKMTKQDNKMVLLHSIVTKQGNKMALLHCFKAKSYLLLDQLLPENILIRFGKDKINTGSEVRNVNRSPLPLERG